MRIFSYIFYTFCKMLKASGDGSPEVSAKAVLSLLQGLLLLVILKRYFDLGGYLIVVLILAGIFLINSYIVFGADAYTKFSKRWDNEPQWSKIIKRILVFIYFAGTFVLIAIL